MRLRIVPNKNLIPPRGGVAKHLHDIYRLAESDEDITLVKDSEDAEVTLVESSWPFIPDGSKMVYVCHGGFVPHVIPTVSTNLENADFIISVGDWLIDKFFPQYKAKSAWISNGIFNTELSNYEDITPKIPSKYVLYAKEWEYNVEDLLTFAHIAPHITFVTTVWPKYYPELDNVINIGLHNHQEIINYVRHAEALLLTGSEVNPIMLLEAWAVGTPVLAKGIDGSLELMKPYDDPQRVVGGALYDSPNADVLDYVLSNTRSLGEQGRRQVFDNYLWVNLWKKYKIIFNYVKGMDNG